MADGDDQAWRAAKSPHARPLWIALAVAGLAGEAVLVVIAMLAMTTPERDGAGLVALSWAELIASGATGLVVALALVALVLRTRILDPLRRLAAMLPSAADATAIGKRLKLSTQQALRLEVMLAPTPVIDVAGGPKAWRAGIYGLGNNLYADRLLLALNAPGDWRAALALARSWMPAELPVSGGDALTLGLKPGPRVGALIEAVERWWIDGDFSADRAACLTELERLARQT